MGRPKVGMNGAISTFLFGGIAGVFAVTFGQYYSRDSSWAKRSLPATDPTPQPRIDFSDVKKFTKINPTFATGDTLFSFGPRSNYFFACRTSTAGEANHSWRTYANKDTVVMRKFLASQHVPIYHTFSPHGDEFAAFTNESTGKISWQFVTSPRRHAQAPTYFSLTRWLEQRLSVSEAELKKTIVVFGPGASYFARTADACTWHDIPNGLEKIILEKKAELSSAETKDSEGVIIEWIPRIVALGANNSWIGIWEDGRFASSLHPKNKLASEFESQMSPSYADLWENLVLSPHNATDYFSATKLGHLDWSLSKHGDVDIGVLEMTVTANVYMQMRAKEDNHTFTMKQRVEGKDINLVLSPNSNWTEEQLTELYSPKWWQAPTNYIRSKFKSVLV